MERSVVYYNGWLQDSDWHESARDLLREETAQQHKLEIVWTSLLLSSQCRGRAGLTSSDL